jgi:hypothetical protein
MLDRVAGNPIDEHPGRRGDKQRDDPIYELAREAMLLWKVNNVIPMHRVKILPDIELEKESQGLAFMKSCSKVLHVEDVDVDTSLLGESTLGFGDEVVHKRPEPNGQYLGDDLSEAMDETKRKSEMSLVPCFLGKRTMLAELSQ